MAQVFTLDRDTGSFLLTQSNVQIPTDTREFAINMSNVRHWEAPVKRYVEELLAGKTGPRSTDFNMRWVASMVADVHRIMSRGGIFMYPRDAREGYKAGRLRLMYEGNPMAFLIDRPAAQPPTAINASSKSNPKTTRARCGVSWFDQRSRAGNELPSGLSSRRPSVRQARSRSTALTALR